MASYELDKWDLLGSVGEGIKIALQKTAAQMELIANNTARLSTDAAIRAQYAQAMWRNLDELSNAAIRALDGIDRSRLDAQLIARVDAMRTELGKVESFSKIAHEADSIGKLMSGLGKH